MCGKYALCTLLHVTFRQWDAFGDMVSQRQCTFTDLLLIIRSKKRYCNDNLKRLVQITSINVKIFYACYACCFRMSCMISLEKTRKIQLKSLMQMAVIKISTRRDLLRKTLLYVIGSLRQHHYLVKWCCLELTILI